MQKKGGAIAIFVILLLLGTVFGGIVYGNVHSELNEKSGVIEKNVDRTSDKLNKNINFYSDILEGKTQVNKVNDSYSNEFSSVLDTPEKMQYPKRTISSVPNRTSSPWWSIQTIDSVGDYSSIAIDTYDNPHISYYDGANDDLKYAHWTGTNWTISTVDSIGDVGPYSSIALDSNEYPHISYYDSTNDHPKYAYWNGGTWVNTTVDSSVLVGDRSTMAIDLNNRPHISYLDQGNQNVKYAYWTGSSWQIKIVGSTGGVVAQTSIDVDSNNRPHIAYKEGGYLTYAYWTGSAWNKQQIDYMSNGEQLDLSLDEYNIPHISYCVVGLVPSALKYATKNGSSWTVSLIKTFSSNNRIYTSITVDSNNSPHIAYFDADDGDLKYAAWMGYSWNIDTADTAASSGYVSIAIDNENTPHISYRAGLKYAYKTLDGFPPNTPYNPIPADAAEKVAINTILSWIGGDPDSNDMVTYDIYFGTNSTPHLIETIGPFPANQSTLTWAPGILNNYQRYWWKIVARDNHGFNVTGPLWNFYTEIDQQNWIFQTIDTDFPDNYYYTSLAVDTLKKPHVAYSVIDSASDIDVKYARYTGSSWNAEYITVGSDSTWAEGVSIDTDSLNNPHVGYQDHIESNSSFLLRHAYKVNNNWNYDIADSDFGSGDYSSIIIDDNDNIHISYKCWDSGDECVGYAYWNGYSWTSQVIEFDVVSWPCSDIAVDSYNNPHILYQGYNDSIIYAKWTGVYWDKQAIELGGSPSWLSIVIDDIDYPHIAYKSSTSSTVLKYAYWNGYAWVISDVVNTGVAGFLSLDLDSNNYPHIAYQSSKDEFYYSYWNGTKWIITAVDGFEVDCVGVSFELDLSDIPHVCYFDQTLDILKYATKTGPGSPPNIPREITPNHGADNIDIDTDLYWKSGDPNNDDTVTYEIYFGNTPSPPYVATIGPYPAETTNLSWALAKLEFQTDYYWKIIAEDNHGNTMESPIYRFKTEPIMYPTADSGDPYYSNPGFPVQFDASDSHDNDDNGCCILQYDWKFFDSDIWNNNISAYPTYNYTTEGIYNISLRVWDDEGLNDTDNGTVYINHLPHPPTAVIDGPYNGIYADMENTPIQFNASLSHDNDENGSSIIRYDWKFYEEDSWHDNLSALTNYTYSYEGEYTVSVRVHDDEGMTDEDTAPVHVFGFYPPTADPGGPYYAMEEYGNEPNDMIWFDGSGSHDNDEHFFHNGNGYCIVNWSWDFGDGYIGYGEQVNHSYADEGTYTVILTVRDNEGNTSSDTTTTSIAGYYPPTAVPGGPYYGIINEPVQFDGTGSHDNDENSQDIVRYDWKYFTGDTWHDDIGSSPNHTYNAIGTYTVSLRVWDDEDPSSYTINNTSVTITNYNDPVADAGGPYSGHAYVPVTFDASASIDTDEGGCCITGYRWDWTNDGTWDTNWMSNPMAQHTYLLGFDGSVRVQVKDNDGSHIGYDEDTSPVSISGNPPTADFTTTRTNNPSIFTFDASNSIDPRPGYDYHDLSYQWDFDNNGVWDKSGNWNQAGIVTWSYSSSGQKTIKLEVTNPDGTDTTTKSIYAFNYNDIVVTGSNKHNFFLGYTSNSVAPTILNKYQFSTPVKGVFDKVSFQLGSNTPVWDTSPHGSTVDIWEGVLTMNEGKDGDQVTVKGYKNNEMIWSTRVNVDILECPGWYQAFLTVCNCEVTQDIPDYTHWKLKVTIPHNKSLGLVMPEKDLPIKMIGGKYKFTANIKPLTYSFTLTDSGTFSIPLISGTVPLGKQINLGTYPTYKVKGGFSFSATATLEGSRNGDLFLVGSLTVGGEVTVEFRFPFFGIPFIAEVGVEGGVKAGFGIGYEFTILGTDGSSLSPANNVIVYSEMGASAGMYLEVLLGLASFSGGVEASGKFYFRIPSVASRVNLYGGAYAKASALWGLWSKKWTYGITYDTGWSSTRETLFDNESLLGDGTGVKSITMSNSDLPALKDYPREIQRGRGEVIIADNAGVTAVPKIVLTKGGKGVAVWSDINLAGNGSSIQSDVYWSVFDGSSWGPLESTNTSSKCEFDPELVVVNNGSGESIVLTFLVVDKVMNESTDVATFYAEPRIHTAVWNEPGGWSFDGENIMIFGGTVNTRDMFVDDIGNIFMVYVKDTDCDPWEDGIGTMYVVNGSLTGEMVEWDVPVVVRSFDDMDLGLQPSLTFVNESMGGVMYAQLNASDNVTTIGVVPTVSGVSGFNESDMVIHTSNGSISYVSSFVDENDIVVLWVENGSCIVQCVVETDPVLGNWIMNPVETVVSNVSVVSLRVVSVENRTFVLFQSCEDFSLYVLELFVNGSWGNLRQVSLDDQFSLGQIDGDSTGVMSQIVYVRDTSFGEWLVGRWRCNEGNGTLVSDDSGYNNNGTLTGNYLWLNQTNVSFDPVYGYGIQFNDTQSSAVVPYDASLAVSDEFTVTCWVNLSTVSTGSVLVGVNGSWMLREVNGDLVIELWQTTGYVNRTLDSVLPVGVWTFIGVTYHDGVVRVVVRPTGVNETVALFDLDDHALLDSGNPLVLGGFAGSIDEVWLFNRDISMSEVDGIWFTPYPTLGCIHDVVVQHLPSFASFNFSVPGRGNVSITTDDVVEFSGSPSGFSFVWDFGDGTGASGQNVSHQYDTGGFYTVICNATDPSTGVVTPMAQSFVVNDTTPPVFSGLLSVVAGDNFDAFLSWSPAADTSSVIYYGFMRNSSGSYNFSSPLFVTDNTSYTVEELDSEMVFFVVRAVDAWGNSDNNMVELSVSPVDNDPPVFDGLNGIYLLDNSDDEVFLEWNESSDPSPPITYTIYISNTSGGQDFDTPLYSTNLTWIIINASGWSDDVYYFVVRAMDVWENEDSNLVERNISLVQDEIPPVITSVGALPVSQTPGGCVNISCLVTDNVEVGLVKVNVSFPGGSGVNVTMELGSTYYYNTSYSQVGVYQYSIWARDGSGNSNVSSLYAFEILEPSVDYVVISHLSHAEIPAVNVSTHFILPCFASGFNDTHGFIDFVDVNWSVMNTGCNASVNVSVGSCVEFYSGWYDGTSTVMIDDGNGHSDSVEFTVNSSLYSMMLSKGWNLVTVPFVNGWSAETLGLNISGCTTVCRFNGDTQTYVTHVVGIPYNDFSILDGTGYFVYCTQECIFSMPDLSIPSVNVSIFEDWNIVGWYHDYDTTAGSLGENISGTTVVCMFNAETQSFTTHVVGIPYNNFTIERGMGVFIYTTEASYWHGEG